MYEPYVDACDDPRLIVNVQDIPETHNPRGGGREPDYQTYLHRIGRTGRFGRVGVSISFVSNRDEWNMLMQISKYFNCDIQRLNTGDWDEVEETIKKTIKSARSQANYAQQQ